MGVAVLVAVGDVVEVGGRAVAEGSGMAAVAIIVAANVPCIGVDEGEFEIKLRGAGPQACSKSTRIPKTIKDLRTPGVYHNKLNKS